MTTLSTEVKTAMRDWVCDCAVDDDDLELREEASIDSIVKYVERYFHGGIEQFLTTM